MTKKNNMIIILDGIGVGKEYPGNAFYQAKTPVIDSLLENYPNTEIIASGEGVGLPSGQMGNSEVGHLNIGAGRVVYQSLLKINNSIKDGSYKENQVIRSNMLKAIEKDKAIHLLGLLSPGGVHSHEKHLYALIELAKELGSKEVYIHIILDGRDVSPHEGRESIKRLIEKIDEIGIGKIGSISGRYYAMDRDNNCERTEKAYDVIVCGEGVPVDDVQFYLEDSYKNNITDEFVIPRAMRDYPGMKDGDTVIFYNFRPDRARQLTRSIVDDDFIGFLRKEEPKVNFVTMTEYDKTIENVEVALGESSPENTLGEYISDLGLNQLRIAETEKYAHVTFFFNGGVEVEFPGEDRILVPSPKVPTFDMKPEMSAYEVTDRVLEAIESEKYDFIVLNFANGDMVGHTGIIPAAIKAVEAVDFNLGRVLDKLKEVNGSALITADHGNCETMLTDDNQTVTSHTTNPVFLILYNYDKDYILKKGGRLCDLAPTILEMMDLDKPEEMTGSSLLEKELVE